ncbi:MAG: hypothetical protein ACKVZJ_06540 [Phycisphaerales bacterium]
MSTNHPNSPAEPPAENPGETPDPMTPDTSAAAQPVAGHAAQVPHAGPRVLCPYCGLIQPVTARCNGCKGLLDQESRQATQNAMGPWQVRNPASPFHPGCSYPTLRELVRRGKVTRETIVRGPTTGQFWSMAANTPGVAVLLGECHACHQPARAEEYLCRHCGVVLSPRTDRQHLGLAPVRPVGVPVSQPPVTSSPQSAFAAVPVEQVPTPMLDVPAPEAGPVGTGDAVPIESLLARRRREDQRRRKMLLIGASSLVAVALAGVLGVALTRGPAVASKGATGSSTKDPAAVGSESTPIVDARVRFAAPLADARRLIAIGDAASLELALGTLERVKTEASAPMPVGMSPAEPKFIEDLGTIIESVRAKLDDARLTEALAETEKK